MYSEVIIVEIKNKAIKMSFRVEEDIYETLCKKVDSSGITTSEYIRRLIKNDCGKSVEIESREDFLFRKQLIWELNHIGNNINQIVKNNNAKFYSEAEKKRLFELMQKIYKLLE
jgi:methylaspartate ammonia-lyase